MEAPWRQLGEAASLVLIDTSVNDRRKGVELAPALEAYVRYTWAQPSRPALAFIDLPTGEELTRPSSPNGPVPLQHSLHQSLAGCYSLPLLSTTSLLTTYYYLGTTTYYYLRLTTYYYCLLLRYYSLPLLSTTSLRFSGDRSTASAVRSLYNLPATDASGPGRRDALDSRGGPVLLRHIPGHFGAAYHELVAALCAVWLRGVSSSRRRSGAADDEHWLVQQGVARDELPPELHLDCNRPRHQHHCLKASGRARTYDFTVESDGCRDPAPGSACADVAAAAGWWWGEDAAGNGKYGWVTRGGVHTATLRVPLRCGRGSVEVGYLASYRGMGVAQLTLSDGDGKPLATAVVDALRPLVRESTWEAHAFGSIDSPAWLNIEPCTHRSLTTADGQSQHPSQCTGSSSGGAAVGDASGSNHTPHALKSKWKLLTVTCASD